MSRKGSFALADHSPVELVQQPHLCGAALHYVGPLIGRITVREVHKELDCRGCGLAHGGVRHDVNPD